MSFNTSFIFTQFRAPSRAPAAAYPRIPPLIDPVRFVEEMLACSPVFWLLSSAKSVSVAQRNNVLQRFLPTQALGDCLELKRALEKPFEGQLSTVVIKSVDLGAMRLRNGGHG